MKRLISFLLSCLLICATLLPIAACSNKDSSGSGDIGNEEQEIIDGYVVLNAYEITLQVGEEFVLDAKLYSNENQELTPKKTEFTVDQSNIAEVSDGTIIAKNAGETYVNIYLDGVSSAVFVTVIPNNLINGLLISLSTQKLYKGVSTQAYALLYEQGVLVSELDAIWSVEDEDILSVDADGWITPKQCTASTKIMVQGDYNGELYTAEKQVSVLEPFYYAFDQSVVRVASNKTLSGKENAKYTTADITLNRVNFLDGRAETVALSDYTVVSLNEEIVQCNGANDAITINAQGAGQTALKATVNANGETAVVSVSVDNVVSDIADMDVLAFACYANPTLLSQNVLLVNDIDYNGAVMLPIAPYNDNVSTRQIGIQWKYWLTKTNEKYELVNRADFGKNGVGLTDEEFISLAVAGGLNPGNKYSFSGEFDGNGYSIKNGELFYGIVTTDSANLGYYASYSSLFGILTGTLKNISFENISLQNPDSVSIEGNEYGINQVYTELGETPEIVNNVLKKHTDGAYYQRGVSIVGFGTQATVENVYLEINETETIFASDGLTMGALVCYGGSKTKITNCVADIQIKSRDKYHIYPLVGTGTSGTTKNNLCIGTDRCSKSILPDKKYYGTYGNWWAPTTEWNALFALSAGEKATNVQSLLDTIASFDSNIWDMSAFGAETNGRPTLKKGCSV